jgi:hypothetical protein
MRPLAVTLPLAVALAACRTAPQTTPAAPRYIVTAASIAVGLSKGLCIGIDPDDAQGVWWWEPGSSGCMSRSTGPDLFHAERAVVTSRRGSDAVEVSFRVQLSAPPTSTLPRFADVRLIVDNGEIRAAASGARVTAARRADLELPLIPPRR